jgi:hypothetical protein
MVKVIQQIVKNYDKNQFLRIKKGVLQVKKLLLDLHYKTVVKLFNYDISNAYCFWYAFQFFSEQNTHQSLLLLLTLIWFKPQIVLLHFF